MDNLNEVTSIWPVLGITVFVGIPAFFGWLSARSAKAGIEGPTADSLARIEATLAEHGERLAALEEET